MTDHKDFYNSASQFYDDMVSFSSLIENRTAWYKTLITQEMKSAADIGCGSGLDTIALSGLGLKVSGFDVSELMVEHAKKNAADYKVQAEFIVSEVDKISSDYHNSFDFITSMGNTFANIEPGKLKPSLEKIRKMLFTRGIFVMQILNYDLILEQQQRIINIKKAKSNTYVRFYDFYPEHINFNILKFLNDSPQSADLLTTKIYPHSLTTITNHLHEAGFSQINTFGSLKMEHFDRKSSKDLIVIAAL